MMRHSNNTFVLSNSVSGSSEPQEELDIYQNNVESGVEDWPNCQPDEVIKIMKTLKDSNLGANKKSFYSSYPSWSSMNTEQRNKTALWFRNLTVPIREAIVKKAQKESLEINKVEKERRESVHKDDLCRLLELKNFPDAQMRWTSAMEPMDRRTLDARNSNVASDSSGRGFLSDDADPYGGLAEIFNNYDTFTPQNRLIKYINNQPVVPYQPASEEVTALAAKCYDLNPTNLNRRNILRNGAWIKEQWINLKTWLTLVLSDFNRSGQHSGRSEADVEWLSDNECRRWVYHSSNNKTAKFPSVLTYAYGTLSKEDFETIGKKMEPGTGRDCGIEDNAKDAGDAREKKRKERKQRAKDSKRRKDTDKSIADVIDETSKRETAIDVLKFRAQQGDQDAIKQLREIAQNYLSSNNTSSSSRGPIHSQSDSSTESSEESD